jgi:hypothetical protein
VVGRDAERNAGLSDLPLRAYKPLSHGRLGDEERPGDLVGCEATQGSERQGNLRVRCERRVAAGEDEAQSLVWDHVRLLRLARRFQRREQLGLPLEGAVAADPVDRPVARRRQQPGTGPFGSAVDRPALERDGDGVLEGVLGEVEVAEDADQAREDPPPLGAEDALELVQCSITGRTSIAPPFRAAGILAAKAIASSRLSHSTR